MSTVIKFENISKQYRLGLINTGTLQHDLNRWWQTNILRREDPYLMIGETNDRSKKGTSEYVWALRNIDFEVNQGDVLGIIGKNGSGKSTLLKILSRITTPTTGSIKARGRIASLLEVGTGFHEELTGRENIYLNGCIMGMTKSEITRKLDEIIDFAGVARYIDTPVKRYSSGMTVRLGFSIAAHLEPEILVVDEVLAVGDAEFQKKAIGKMQDVSRGGGRTVLFVSHNMGAVRKLCKTGVLLENGTIKHSGKITDVIEHYLEAADVQTDVYCPKDNVVKEVSARQNRDKIELTLKYESDVPIMKPNFGFTVYDAFDNPIFGTEPIELGILDYGNPKKTGEVKAEVTSPHLANGLYYVSAWFSDGCLHDSKELLFGGDKCILLNIYNMNDSFMFKEPQVDGVILPILTYNFI